MGATTLTVSQMPSHTHTYTYRINQRDCGWSENPQMRFWLNEKSENTGSSGGSTTHTHSLTGSKSTSASSFPPYYTLAYIMRCA